jgi:hypothetical protein
MERTVGWIDITNRHPPVGRQHLQACNAAFGRRQRRRCTTGVSPPAGPRKPVTHIKAIAVARHRFKCIDPVVPCQLSQGEGEPRRIQARSPALTQCSSVTIAIGTPSSRYFMAFSILRP